MGGDKLVGNIKESQNWPGSQTAGTSGTKEDYLAISDHWFMEGAILSSRLHSSQKTHPQTITRINSYLGGNRFGSNSTASIKGLPSKGAKAK